MERRFIKSGIPGLDEVLGGGFLEGSIVTVGGPTGAGKSTLAMQFLYNGATESGEPGLYISIEESRRDVFFHMGGYDWDLAKAERERKFILLDYPIHEVDQILNQYSAIQEIINSTGVKRLVIDSIMPIALYFKDDDERKRGFLKLIENIRKWGVTTLIVSEDVKPTDIGAMPNSIFGLESFTDGWINIFYHYDEKKGERLRFIEVLKMKGISHSAKPYPVLIGKNGFAILQTEAPKPPAEQPKAKAPEKPKAAEPKTPLPKRLAAAKKLILKKK